MEEQEKRFTSAPLFHNPGKPAADRLCDRRLYKGKQVHAFVRNGAAPGRLPAAVFGASRKARR